MPSERMERVQALNHNLPVEVQENILSFEMYPIHPVAALIKDMEFEWSSCPKGIRLEIFSFGGDFKHWGRHGYYYSSWTRLRLWRTLSPDWVPGTYTCRCS